MSEKQYKYLRKQLGYKPSYKNRKYSFVERIKYFLRTGKLRPGLTQQLINKGHRKIYRDYKKRLNRFDPYAPDKTK